MDYIDLNNLSDSFATETSSTIEGGLNGGGFFWSSNGCSNNDMAAIKAAREKRFDALLFMEENNLINNHGAVDQNGATLLHYLIPYVGTDPVAAKLFEKLVGRSNVTDFINVKNREGCTPLHTAVEVDANDVAHTLVQKGADSTIADNKGRRITATQVEINSDNGSVVRDGVNPLLRMIKQLMDVKKIDTLGNDTETIQSPRQRSLTVTASEESRSDDFLKHIIDQYTDKSSLMIGGGDSELRMGQRKLKLTQRRLGSIPGQQNELSRLMNNQSNVIHDRVIKKIMEIMSVDETEAKVYKAAIYHKVKNDNPNLSNLDRAIEMEKNTTKEFIKKLDIEETRSSMKKHFAEKDSNPRPEKNNKSDAKPKRPRKSAPKSETPNTTDPVLDGGYLSDMFDDSSIGEADGFSETSFF